MKAQILSLLAGTAIIATVSVAQASEPMGLSESQMDQVTAGAYTLKVATAVLPTFNFVTGVWAAASATGIEIAGP